MYPFLRVRLLLFLVITAACVPEPSAISDAGGEETIDAAPDAAEPDAIADTGEAEDTGEPADTGVFEDAGEPEDSGVPEDAGLEGHCPVDVNPACRSAADCAEDIPPPSNCESCIPANLSLCVDAECLTPPTLDTADIYGIATQVNPTIPPLESVGAFAFASRTAGDRTITCAEIYAGAIDFADRCYNVLDSKSIPVSQNGDTYTVGFNSFASGQRTLFVIFGHTEIGARGDPVGVSCTELDVGPPTGAGPMFFAGDPMRRL